MKKIRKDDYWPLCTFLMDYHSGQWSRGYRLLCKLDPRNFNQASMKEDRETWIYNYLVTVYGNAV